jgi:3-dehydroquinate synthase
MGASRVSEPLVIQSHRGPYSVHFEEEPFLRVPKAVPARAHYIVDSNVAALYQKELKEVLAAPSVLLVEALESNKSLEACPAYVEHLVAHGVRRGHALVAIGGGIIQDITCFLAATLLRGLEWHFYPTTLLAQADSCIGSKSSINVGQVKNVVGTYTPPVSVHISTRVLATLPECQIRSGIGEMLKVHAIAGPEAFDRIAADYDAILKDPAVMRTYILRSLEIKKSIIEQDEFDRGIRNVMNLGHSFGHAIESATDYAVPHGIAVTIGTDMANFMAGRLGFAGEEHFRRMHPTLAKNYRGFDGATVPLERFFSAIGKDKKNTEAKLALILPNASGKVGRVECDNDGRFRAACKDYFENACRP